MEIVFDGEEQDEYETEIIDGILTLDELMKDDYYKSEIEKLIQQRLDIQNSHSDVKGGNNTMNRQVQTPTTGDEKIQGEAQPETQPNEHKPEATGNPAVENMDAGQSQEPAREMSAQQFDLYNETLRRVSKTAKAGLPNRYNAFEDAEVKALVKQQVMGGNTPNVKELAASVVARLTPKQESPHPDETQAKKDDGEVLSLKAELALLKAGITSERIDAAKKLFIAEGGDLSKAAEFAAKYPEWQKQEQGVVFTKAAPLAGKTAPTPDSQPVLNDFERAVVAARKKAGLE